MAIMNKQDAIRASLCGRVALSVQSAAETLYQTGGQKILSEGTRLGIQHLLKEVSQRTTVASGHLLGPARAFVTAVESSEIPVATASRVGRSVALGAGQVAAKEIARGAGKAAGLAFLVDGAFGAGRALQRYRKGEYSRKQACVHVLKEASTGAAASAVGLVAASTAVALTGGLAAPVLLGIVAGSSMLTKLGLRSLVGE